MSTIKEFTLPKTSDNVDESLVVLWYKEEGDFVEEGENVLEIQTEKANMEVESPLSGIIKEILIKRGETARVGQPLARIEVKDDK